MEEQRRGVQGLETVIVEFHFGRRVPRVVAKQPELRPRRARIPGCSQHTAVLVFRPPNLDFLFTMP